MSFQGAKDKSYSSDNKIKKTPGTLSDIYFCPYCNINFENKMTLQEHCKTDEHQGIILSDEGRDWKYRPPPRGILSSEYKLCQSFLDKNLCRFSNQCIFAHSEYELNEWKERFNHRTMKLERAREKELHGVTYTDRLLDKLKNSQHLEQILTDNIDGLSYNVSSDVNVQISEKPSKYEWTITLHCQFRINTIALLHDSHRTHFSLTNVTIIYSEKNIHKSFKLNNVQEWINPEQITPYTGNCEYKIQLNFDTEIYGTFRQAIVIDFGHEPVFMKKFCVDIVPLEDFKSIESVKTILITQEKRWCKENTDIVLFNCLQSSSEDEKSTKYLKAYQPPTDKNIFVNQSSLEKFPTTSNYINRMHDLLYFEEMAQFDLLSHFNIRSYLHLTKSYLLLPNIVSEVKYAMPGELYAKLDLSSEISEDTAHGRLILNNCNSLFISLENRTSTSEKNSVGNQKRTAYEALIDCKTKKEIYLHLSKKTVENLKLVQDTDVAFDIQFQLNRLPFCEMHYAIDHISCIDRLFPDVISEPTIPWSPSIQWNSCFEIKLNLKQKEALVAITSNSDVNLPPILVIGPFGTGKTFTLAQAIKQLLQLPHTRILVCTHSNSAADIYIKDYLHPLYESGFAEAKPLRIYYTKRRVGTVQSVVQQYCLIEYSNGDQKFILPTKEQFSQHRIIVTTINTSICLADLGIKRGYFTHILIDEAAQIMECSTLIPLTLASSSTRIVLAGDYMQLGTEVFSSLCQEKNLQNSLLERLYDLYPPDYPCKVMLVENYRSHPAIIKYTSNLFYDGKLIPRSKISPHPRYHPLTFFTARGEDVQETNSTTFYNNSEILEICERITEIINSWPVELWGPVKEDSISVVSPYLDQVVRIRSALRKKKLYKISVERVLNVQGKEFRVVILSTVRTRHTCTDNDSTLDFGFLSNAKLLTTAITRAQSLVAVVGDPVSLCSLGKCRKLWEAFIRQCSEANSLHGISWVSLRSQLVGIELKKIYGLNPLAQEFIPRYLLLPSPVAILPPSPYSYYPYIKPMVPSRFPPVVPFQYPTSFVPPNLHPFAARSMAINQPVYYRNPMVYPYTMPNLGYPLDNICNPKQNVPFGTVQGMQVPSMYDSFPQHSQMMQQKRFYSYPNVPLEVQRSQPTPQFYGNFTSSPSSVSQFNQPQLLNNSNNIQFLGNVHFPKATNENTVHQTKGNLERDMANCSLNSDVESAAPDLKEKENPINSVRFSRYNNHSNNKISSVDELFNTRSTRNENGIDSLLFSSSRAPQISSGVDQSKNPKQFLTLQEVEKSLHSDSQTMNTLGERIESKPSFNFLNSTNFPHKNEDKHSSNPWSLFNSDSNSWDNSVDKSLSRSIPDPLRIPSVLPTANMLSGTADSLSTASNLPLYLRRGNEYAKQNDAKDLGSSKGWDANTVNSAKVNKPKPNEPRTYAGVLRSKNNPY